MKLTIDTQVDTHEDIRKVLQILASILEKKEPSSLSTDTASMMSMFGDPAPQNTQTGDKAPDFSSFLHLQQSGSKKEDKPVPKIEFF